MAAFGTVYLDTNIFIMAYEANDKFSELLSEIFAKVDGQNNARFATSELTLSELLVRPIRENDEAVRQYEDLIAPSDWLNVFPAGKSILIAAAALRAKNSNLKLPDAIHVATAIHAKCSHILTNDHGSKGTYSFPKKDPASEGVVAVPILRPDEPTLNALIKSLSA
jgi:predicted nucleic acid-binding protein